jgi:hypothetical protein
VSGVLAEEQVLNRTSDEGGRSVVKEGRRGGT